MINGKFQGPKRLYQSIGHVYEHAVNMTLVPFSQNVYMCVLLIDKAYVRLNLLVILCKHFLSGSIIILEISSLFIGKYCPFPFLFCDILTDKGTMKCFISF